MLLRCEWAKKVQKYMDRCKAEQGRGREKRKIHCNIARVRYLMRTGSHRFAPVRTDSFRAYRHTHMLACLCVLFSSVDVTSYLTSVDFPKDYTYRVSSFVQILGLQKKNQSSLLSDFLLITIVNHCEVSISSHCSTPKLCLLIPHLHHPLCSCAQPSLLL